MKSLFWSEKTLLFASMNFLRAFPPPTFGGGWMPCSNPLSKCRLTRRLTSVVMSGNSNESRRCESVGAHARELSARVSRS